ncbi:hypothetical protein [Agrococcus sediminis]|uniref:hypothetical protein n=1 Tax=Agrococcus sediminis TaxID=2599924 RepID=UPI00342D015D
MARRCNVCSHPAQAAIDAALLAGGSLRRVASQFANVSKDSLNRHLAHLPDETRAEVAIRADLSATSIASRLAESAEDARAARQFLLGQGRYREAARLADVEARALGTLADRLAVGDLSQVALAREEKALAAALRSMLVRVPQEAEGIVADLRLGGFHELADDLAEVAKKFTPNPMEVSA